MFNDIHIVGVVVATVVYMIVGALWYSPILFAKKWMELSGMSGDMSPEQKASARNAMMLGVIPGLITALVIERIFYHLPMVTVPLTLSLVFLIWLGFTAAPYSADYIYGMGKKSWTLFAINQGFTLVAFMLMTYVMFYF
jgi:hypothetical protein